MMIQLFNPKYIIPIIGEYRHQYGLRKLSVSLGYSEDDVLILENGDAVNFQNEDMFVGKRDIKAGEILIDGTPIGNTNDYVMKDREILAEDGTLLIVAHVNPKQKKIIGEIEIVTKGFVYIQSSEELLNQVKELFEKISKKHLKSKYINWNDFKREARNGINRFLYSETKRKPITIPVLISVDDN